MEASLLIASPELVSAYSAATTCSTSPVEQVVANTRHNQAETAADERYGGEFQPSY